MSQCGACKAIWGLLGSLENELNIYDLVTNLDFFTKGFKINLYKFISNPQFWSFFLESLKITWF